MSNKSEATWHPGDGPTPPEGPHADLRGRLEALRDESPETEEWERPFLNGHPSYADRLHAAITDALAALSDSVPREQYDEALAVIEQVRALVLGVSIQYTVQAEAIVISNVADAVRLDPADALARLKAEVWDECRDAITQAARSVGHSLDEGFSIPVVENPYRAAALREGAA